MKLALTFLSLAGFAATANASLISIGAVPTSGNGIGAVSTSLTFQATAGGTTESGCVAFNGTTSFTGASACPVGFTGGSEGNGASQTNVFTASQLGFSATTNFSNLVLLFNGNEGGNAADQSITLSSLGLNLYSSAGLLLGSFTTTAPFTAASFPGVGNAGYGFALDAAQAAQANALLLANPTLRIGTSATAINANGGPETIQLTTLADTGVSGNAVPEPGTSVMLISGLLLLGLGRVGRKS